MACYITAAVIVYQEYPVLTGVFSTVALVTLCDAVINFNELLNNYHSALNQLQSINQEADELAYENQQLQGDSSKVNNPTNTIIGFKNHTNQN